MKKALFVFLLLFLCLIAQAFDFTINKMKYTLNPADSTVSVSAQRTSLPSGDLEIASLVEYNGKIYRVSGISNWGFLGCTRLKSVRINDGISFIGNQAFQDCCNLTSVDIPSSVTQIQTGSFAGCSALSSVKFPSGLTSIWGSAFSDCCSLTSITFPNSLVTIGNRAFEACDRLSAISIPSSVIRIGAGAFGYCVAMKQYTVAENSQSFTEKDGVLLTKDLKTIVAYPNAKSKKYSIPEGITSIGEGAFEGSISLTTLTIPSSLNWMPGLVFWGCSSLKTIIFNTATPPKVDVGMPSIMNKDACVLIVPKSSREAFMTADFWNDFKQIKED